MAVTSGQFENIAVKPADRPLPRRPLVWVFLAVAAGIIFDRLVPLGSPAWGLAAALAAWGLWLLLYRRRLDLTAACVLVICAIGLGAAWHHLRWHLQGQDDIGRYAPAPAHAEPVCLRGRAITAPAVIPAPPPDPMRSIPAEDMARLTIEVEAIRDLQRWRPASGRTSVSVAGHLVGVRPGDRLLIFGQMAAEASPANPGEHDFSADARRDGRSARVRCESPDCVSLASGSSPSAAPSLAARLQDELTDLRRRGSEMLWRYLSHEQAGLAAAILLGDRDELPREQIDAYVETGTVHLLAVSGQQVSILAAGLFFGLRLGWLRRRWGLAIVAVLTIIYALMTNAEPPVVRAAILVVAFCVALGSSRTADSINVLALAGLAVLLLNPADLFRVGPQLSFLAVATLIWFARWRHRGAAPSPLDRLLASARPWPVRAMHWCADWFWQLTLAGVAVSLVALPLCMFHFNLVSPAGVLLTPLLMLPMAGALLCGLGILLFGWLLPPVAKALGGFCDICLTMMNRSVDVGHALPGSHFWVAGPPLWWLLGFYAALGSAICWPRYVPPRRWCVGLLGGWIALGFGIGWWSARGDDELRVTFLSVGHGAAVVMELPDGRTLLYDAGRMGSPYPAARAVGSYLWSRGRTHIDAIVISHADADHYNAIPRLLTQFSVGAIYMSPQMLAEESPGVVALRQAIATSGVPMRTIYSGQRLEAGAGRSGTVQIDVLHPPRRGLLTPEPERSDNAHSIVLAVEYAGRRLLLPGDLEGPGITDLIAEEPWDTDILLAPHHGSPRSDPPGFSSWCRPEWIVLSGGHEEASEAESIRAAYRRTGRQLFNTASEGAVQTTIIGGDIQVATFNPGFTGGLGGGFQVVSDQGRK
ncbi:MAG: ComEC/Rec2 family competence protein [Planctomycetes bacterium]|nr:ComEC/Rec2 family competence protein [Planctomycetota bacterium]